ncbi:M23 family metallopeptidase [uncultured Sphingomonas sp.]|uniref:M23 family metallopeptidase n=1 Tax=uncultured Sphingomonas sp. TaxID=158754 RepID=UPI0026188770|nr:M23 family metallopeptidase [uncultured Sphingomonas sp.]
MTGAGRWLGAAALMTAAAGCVSPPVDPPAPVRKLAPPAPPPPASLPLPRFALSGTARQGAVMLGTAPAGAIALSLDGSPIGVAPDHRFIIAFDRDAAPRATLAATLADGRQVTQELEIAPGDWRIERLDTVAKTPVPSAEFARRRPPELAEIRAARETRTDAQGWRQHFIWPATGRISGLFGAQRIYRGEPGAYHGGVDVAKPAGAPVVAPADGVVILAATAPFTLEGNLLMIDHGMGLNSAFLHLSKIAVKVGEHVRQGQEIGLVGATGRASGPHLHWAMMWQGRRIDPMLLAGAMAR